MDYQAFIAFAAFILALVFVGSFRSNVIKTQDQYLLANRNTPLFALVATLVMTEFNTATLIAFSSLGYQVGSWAVSLSCVFLFGLLFYAFSVAKKWKAFNGISVAQFFTERYGKTLGNVIAFILFFAMAGFSATYIKSLTFLFLPLFPHLSPWILSALLVASVLFMSLRGGLIAIIRTDILSFIAILIFLPSLFYLSWHLPNTSQIPAIKTFQQMQQQLPPEFIISLILLTMFSYILAPWYGQKIVSAKSQATAFSAVIMAAIIIFLLYGLGILSASIVAKKGIVLGDSQMALPNLIRYHTPPLLQGLGYGILFAISATTLSGVWSAMVTLSVPITKRLIKNSGPHHTYKYSLYLTLGLACFCYLIANVFIDQILNNMILVNIPIIALSFALLGGFYWKKTSTLGVCMSICVGLVCGTVSYLHYGMQGMYTWYWAVYGIPLIFISGIIGSLLTQRKKALADIIDTITNQKGEIR